MSETQETQLKSQIEPQIDESKAQISEVKGTITTYIGEGNNARNNIVYLVLKSGFIAGIIISILITIHVCVQQYIFLEDKPNEISLVDEILKIWQLFCPIVSLALGYLFGHSKRID